MTGAGGTRAEWGAVGESGGLEGQEMVGVGEGWV